MTPRPMRAGVIGHPISHSLSPPIHRAWLAAKGLEGTYDAFDVAPHDLKAFVERHRGGETLRGVNVTIPHKEPALALADVADAAASGAGAANVLLFRSDGLVEARNTDGRGLLEALAIHTVLAAWCARVSQPLSPLRLALCPAPQDERDAAGRATVRHAAHDPQGIEMVLQEQ